MIRDHALIAVPLALGAAASFAVSNVAQLDAVSRRRSDKALDAGLLFRLVTEPVWVAGLAASILGFAFEAIALSMAPVVLVQPLIVAELPFALPMAALVAGRRLGRREWAGIVMVTAGLFALVSVIHPRDALVTASAGMWGLLFGAITVAVAGLLFVGRRARGIGRTSAYAAAAGATFGLLSVVTKATTHVFATRGIGALGSWQPWALAVIGIVGLSLAQNAYHAGPLAVSLPLLDVGEPLVGSLIAVFVFGEELGRMGRPAEAVLALALAAIVSGVATLDRSPLVQAAQSGISEQQLSHALTD